MQNNIANATELGENEEKASPALSPNMNKQSSSQKLFKKFPKQRRIGVTNNDVVVEGFSKSGNINSISDPKTTNGKVAALNNNGGHHHHEPGKVQSTTDVNTAETLIANHTDNKFTMGLNRIRAMFKSVMCKEITEADNANETNSMKFSYKLKKRNSVENFAHISLLSPAFILNPNMHGSDTLTSKFAKKLKDNLQLKLAAAHINDAINGRGRFGEARATFKSPTITKCFKIISNVWWTRLLYLVIAVHCLMMLWEQPFIPATIGYKWQTSVSPAIPCIDALCLLVYIIDLVVHIKFLTWRNIWSAKENFWIRVELVFTFLFLTDLVVLIIEVATQTRLLCPFRCLRASMLLCKSKNVAHIFNVLLSIISKLGKVLLIIAIFIITFASIGLHVFMYDYHSLPQTCSNETYSWNCTNIYTGAFDQVANAALHMFVLMSTENYPEFIIPAFVKNWANFFYFGLFLYAGVFFLTAILLAIIVESYWDYSKRHVKQERRQQREELAKAWNLMDPLGNGQLSVNDPKLTELFHILKPKNTREENQELINYISMYGDGVIDSYDWTTKLIETLSFEFEAELHSNDENNTVCNSKLCCFIQKICRIIVHGRATSVATLVLILLHSVLFCLMWSGISDNAQLAVQSTRTTIIIIFVIEAIFRVVADGKGLWNLFDVLDILMIITASIGCIVWYVLWYMVPRASPINLGACVVVSSVAILIRAVFNSQHARSAVIVLQNIYPVMFDLILLVITIIYLYAVIGLEIFQDKTLYRSEARGYTGSYVEYGCGVGFETFGCSLLIVFQIVTTNDWHEIMLGAMNDAGWPSAFYFVSCYLIVDMIVMNLFVAISIEAYKKLARDNTQLAEEPSNLQPEELDTTKVETSFSSAAKTTLNEIFASSRKSRASIGSNTLTGFSSSPYAVRRGTLGSLARSPSPSPRVSDDETMLSVRSQSNSPRRPSVRREKQENEVVEDKQSTSMERREMMLKQRHEQRRKERRKTKHEEDETIKNQLQIDGVVRLKRAVRVIKNHHARDAHEMNLKEGDLLTVMEEVHGMMRGSRGWFPSENVINLSKGNGNPDHPHVVVTSDNEILKNPKVKFEIGESGKRNQPSPNHRISRMRRKTDGADWRKNIHGEITMMNPDELRDLSKIIRGGLERRHPSYLHSVPSQLAISVSEELLEEDEEIAQLPQVTVSQVNSDNLENVEHSPSAANDTHTQTLTVPDRGRPRVRKKTTGDGSIPDWMQKFVDEKKIFVDKDVKLEESRSSLGDDEQNQSNKSVKPKESSEKKDAESENKASNKITSSKLKRKNKTTPENTKKSVPGTPRGTHNRVTIKSPKTKRVQTTSHK
ncbi:uncharacterized protein LOC100179610 [Ciona intestinalis]